MSLKSPMPQGASPSSHNIIPAPSSTFKLPASIISPLTSTISSSLQDLLSHPIQFVKEMNRSVTSEQPVSLGTDQPKRRKFTLTEYKLRSSFTKAMETGNSSVFKKQNQRKCSEESLASESESRSESPGERSKEVSTKDDKRNAVQKEVSESATLKTKYEDNKATAAQEVSESTTPKVKYEDKKRNAVKKEVSESTTPKTKPITVQANGHKANIPTTDTAIYPASNSQHKTPRKAEKSPEEVTASDRQNETIRKRVAEKSPGTVAVPDKKVETVRKHVAEPDTEIEPARIKRRKSQSSNSEDLNKQPLSPLNDSAQKSKSSPKLQSAKQTDSLVSKPSEPVKTGGNAASSPKERQKGKALAVQSPTSQKRLRGDSAQDEKPKKKTRIGGNLDEGQALASSSSQTQSQAVSAQDEEMFWKEFPSSDFENHTARGIPNSGYYCYRNSTVQALLHVPALYDYFTNHHRESCERERTNCICCLLGIFAKYHYSDETCSENAKSKALALIDKMLGREFAVTGWRHEQQDADEYSTLLIDRAIEQLKGRNKKSRTPLEDILEVVTVQSVTCQNKRCQHVSQTRSQNTTMRAKMTTAKKASHLNDLIESMSRSEFIKDYKCEKCGKSGASINRQHAELPPALMVHVNRGYGNRTGTAKIQSWLKFEPEMELKTENGTTQKYTLKSVVSHMGGTLNSGHYVSFVRNPDNKGWSYCSDSTITACNEARFRGEKNAPRANAYILMYTKV